MESLTIAFFGSSLVSAYWNGAATYYRGLLHALARRGHRISFYEPDAFDRQAHRDIPDPEWARVVVYPADRRGVEAALDEARASDVVVKASGVGVHDRLLEEAVPEVAARGGAAVYWDVDAPATLDRVEDDPDDPFRALVPRYDLVLTYGGGPRVVEGYGRLGARECVPIYNALDSTTHYPGSPDSRFAGDLAFLGNRLPDREARVEEFFLRPARILPSRRFVLGGSGWEQKDLPPNVRHVGHVFTRDHNAFNCTPRAVLNVNRASMARYGYSPPTRIFEAAGAGACIVTDRWEGIEAFLEPGFEVLVAEDGDEVVGHLRDLHPARARSIGNAARRKVLARHTYAHRAREVERVLAGAGAMGALEGRAG